MKRGRKQGYDRGQVASYVQEYYDEHATGLGMGAF